jgi:hypothetical protein
LQVVRAGIPPGLDIATVNKLLVFTAVLEAATGGALLAVPAMLVTLLLGGGLDSPTSVVVARVAGAALLALGVACWCAHGDARSRAARGVVAAMLLYDVIVFALVLYSGVGLRESGIGLWPAAAVHLALAAWSFAGLQSARRTEAVEHDCSHPAA